MKIYKIFERLFLRLIYFLWYIFVKIHEIKNIIKKRNIYNCNKLSIKQKKQVNEFYKKNYGRKISYKWHRLYTSYTGNFDYKYIPEYIFTTELERLGNKRLDVLPLENKNLIPSLFLNVDDMMVLPKTYVMRVNGIYFDQDMNVITKSHSIDILHKLKTEFVIKISRDSNSGRGVKIINLEGNVDKNSNKLLADIFEEMGNDFIVQEKIKSHSTLKKLYPKAINTFRVITFISDDGFHVAPLTLKIGNGGG